MAFTFDGVNKIIQCNPGTDQFSASTIYSSWKRWVQQGDNAKYPRAFEDSVGSNPLGGSLLLGSYYFITNGWKIRPQNTDHTLILDGNLFPVPDTAGIFIPTIDPKNVIIAMRTSSLTQQLLIEQADPVDELALATAVWDKDVSAINTANYAGTVLKQSGTDAAQAASQTAAAVSAAQAAETAALAAETAATSADSTAAANAANILAAKAAAEAAETAALAAETAASAVAGDAQTAATEATAAKVAAQAAQTAALAAETAALAAATPGDIAPAVAAAQAAEAAAEAAKASADLAAALSA